MRYSCDEMYEKLKKEHSYEYIDPLNLNTKKIEWIYSLCYLDVQRKPRNEDVERRIKIKPSFVGYFYNFIKDYRMIPNQQQYIEYYFQMNQQWINDTLNQEQQNGLYGRLCRFYPSMLRDFHFYHLLREIGLYEKVYYNLECDLEAKIDIFVRKNNEWYGLQLRTETKNSNYFYEEKKKRNPKIMRAKMIDVPINMNGTRELQTQKDSLKLYDIREIKYIEQQIHRMQTSNIADKKRLSI